MISNRAHKRYLGLALPALSLSLHSLAAEQGIEEVEVLGQQMSLALPIKTIDQQALDKAEAGNMTKLLETLPGINNASYGEAVGRPVIRGLSANRVKLSVNGATNADVSAMSADHAPMMEIANAEEIEIIYGPNTLRFGSGAMGGLVNINDGRFHEKVIDGLQGRVQGSLGSNANTAQTAAALDFGMANGDQSQAHIGHIDFVTRSSDNYSAGDRSGFNDEIESSSSEALGGSLAYNFVDSDAGNLGVAIAYSDYEYGLPNDENLEAKVTPEQWRVDVQGSLLNVSSSLQKWETKFSYIDYQHEELIDDKPEALFEKKVSELQSTLFFHTQSDWKITTGIQLEYEDFALCHDHAGCLAIPDYSDKPWDGSPGAQLIEDTDGGFRFSHSTPMPLTETLNTGLFVIAGKTIDTMTAEIGARYESSRINLDPNSITPLYRRDQADYADEHFKPLSVSAGLSWDLDEQRIAVNLSHSERAPTVDEMYYNGDHHATFSYQLDNYDLDIESANSIDVTWQFNLGQLLLNTAVFYYDFDDYIYNDIKAVKDPYHGRDVYRYEQADASFAGAELSVDLPITEQWLWFANMDVVQAQLKQGANKNLPRIPPATLLTGLKWVSGAWDIEANVHYHLKQDDVADNESITNDYTLINAYAAYRMNWDETLLTLQLKASNLANEYGINHASYLKDISPVQGRNIALSFIVDF